MQCDVMWCNVKLSITWTLCRRPVLDLGTAPVAEEEEEEGPGWGSDEAEKVLCTDLYLWFYVDI